MIRWIKKIKERYNAYDDLIYVLSNDPAVVRGGKAGAARQVVTKLSPATAIKVHDIAAIIEIMQNAEIKHAAHLTAVLDGEIVPTLGAGVL